MTKQDKSEQIGILLLSHGGLGKNFLEGAQMIYQAPLQNVEVLSIKASYDRETVRDMVNKCVARLAKKTGKLVIMCDTNGATPSRLLKDKHFSGLELRCVYGFNLPMLLDCINYRCNADLDKLVEHICQVGKDAISWRCTNTENGD